MILQGEIEKQSHIYYEFDRSNRIGAGGMGTVYRGRMVDESTGAYREVAIKEVQPEGDAATRQLVLDRARREASICFHNDNIVEMLGFVETSEKKLGMEKTRYYIVSEFLDGVTLDKVLEGVCTDYQGNEIHFARDLADRYGHDREATSEYIIKNVLSAIVALHDNGYLHRDIDPSNIMITSDGKIKLIDFGIAKKQDALTSSDGMQSEEGSFVGKVEYAAPELVSGKVSMQDFSTDIYAIGVMFYRLLTGHLPFEGNRFDIIKAQMSKKPDLSSIKSKKFRAIVGKALAKQQKQRYPSASAMRAALDGGEPAPSWVIFAAAGGGVLAIVILIIALLGKREPPIPDYEGRITKEFNLDSLTRVTQVWENGELVSSDTVRRQPILPNSIDITEYLSKSAEELWSMLGEDNRNPAVLYALSQSFEGKRAQDDKMAKQLWDNDIIPNELAKYLDVSVISEPDALSTTRLRYILLCMAYDNAGSVSWKDPGFVEALGNQIVSMRGKGYKLPSGLASGE